MSTVNSVAHGKHHHAHHYDSAEHQYLAAKFGTWVFLCTEILMFGGLFVGYIIYHQKFPQMFHEGSKFCDWRLGGTNTLVLIFSSLTMALSIYYAQLNQKKKSLASLYITLICGFIFLGIKYIEYTHKFHEGLFPGRFFAFDNPEEMARWKAMGINNMGMFFSFYFVMTGIHASHVIAGMGLITWLIIRTHRGDFDSDYYTPLECVGLFWHLVDLIWIYLFPLLYLIS